MRRKSLFVVFFCFTVILLFPSLTVHAENNDYTYVYTYTYDYWSIERESPDAYNAETVLTGEDLGIGGFKDPQGMYVRDNRVYICDTGNNRIVIMEKVENKYKLVEQFSEFQGDTDIKTFNGPQDIYVTKAGDMIICDTNNQRVVQLSADHKFIKELTRPNDETVDQSSDFLPLKVVADKAGRIIVLVKNYNKGFVEYKNNGEFVGYIGANEVKFNIVDYFWKMVSTKAQRAQMEQFVPTEYNNLALDQDDFIYCTTAVFDDRELQRDKAKPIRKLNAMGKDILIKNGTMPPIGDEWWGDAAGINGSSRFSDVTAMDNGTYFTIDRVRGRIFHYDDQGHLLYAFGSVGNKVGYFQYPTALEHMGDDLLVLDSKSTAITILSPTPYGTLINNALAEYKKGNYDKSSSYWEQVVAQNGNYDMAYIGIGRSLYRQGEYKEAMKYFKSRNDAENYSKAFQHYRKEWIEDHIVWIMALFFGLIIIPSVVGFVKKIKMEVGSL
jgi:tetratricopeptide (TPR) repeat protein